MASGHYHAWNFSNIINYIFLNARWFVLNVPGWNFYSFELFFISFVVFHRWQVPEGGKNVNEDKKKGAWIFDLHWLSEKVTKWFKWRAHSWWNVLTDVFNFGKSRALIIVSGPSQWILQILQHYKFLMGHQIRWKFRKFELFDEIWKKVVLWPQLVKIGV